MDEIVRELRKKQALLRSEIQKFMEMTDPEQSRVSSARIKELSIDIVNLRKEMKSKKKRK